MKMTRMVNFKRKTTLEGLRESLMEVIPKKNSRDIDL
jgi:hypothetical protein